MTANRPLSLAASVTLQMIASKSRVVVTGAGGWFGMATLEMLETALKDSFDERVLAFASTERSYRLRSGRQITLYPLSSLSILARSAEPTVFAHYAFLTREKVSAVGQDSYITENRNITAFVAAQARRLEAAGIFSTSSGAVYEKDGSLAVDLNKNPYGVLKLEEEAAFHALRNEIGSRTAACRVFNVAGPFLNKNYALGSLIDAALFQDSLHIRARHRVFRSYAHIRDIIAVGLAVATSAILPPPNSYDTAGELTVEVEDLAERIKLVLECRHKPIVRDLVEALPEDRYVGDRVAYEALALNAGFRLTALDDQIRETADYLASRSAEGSI